MVLSDTMHADITGVVDIVTYRDDANGFAILKIKPDKQYKHLPIVNRKGYVTIKGGLARIGIGEKVHVKGKVSNNSQYGPSITVDSVELMEPQSHTEIQNYLAKNVFLIGPQMAAKIVGKFGEDTFKVMDEEPDRLLEIEGIGKKRLEEIKALWREQRELRELLQFFTRIGLSTNYLTKVYKKYGNSTISMIQADPYMLAREIDGIGFVKADEVAKHLGLVETSDIRVRALAEHIINELGQRNGDCFVYRADLIRNMSEWLASHGTPIGDEQLSSVIDHAVTLGILGQEENRLYSANSLRLENRAANKLSTIFKHPLPHNLTGDNEKRAYDAAVKAAGVQLHEVQDQAIRMALKNKVSIITGGPGTGKTTIIKSLLAGFTEVGLPVTMLAPTGRAAKVMRDRMQYPASTIHKQLYQFEKALAEGGHLQTLSGVIIIDETSMVGLKTFAWLLKFIDDDAVVVIVGDKDQLPSVESGAVLRDLLSSNAVPKTILTYIFRQAQTSKIIVSAHSINRGEMPELYIMSRNQPFPENTDFYTAMIAEDDKQAEVATWCVTKLAQRLGFNPLTDCQVLAPMYRGNAGVANLNTLLQRALNPEPIEFVDRGMGIRWGVGDKLMQIKNNYDKMVFNGDIGIIKEIEKHGTGRLKRLVVDFDGNEADFTEAEEFQQLQLAYASTIHKVQGSEFPMVVMLMHTSHYQMLQRNLFYTGITRSRKAVVLIAHPSAISTAISNNYVARRNTFLAEKIRSHING